MANIDVRYSKDGGHNWSDWRKMDMGEIGQFMYRVQMRRFGIGRQWVFDLRVTDNVRADLITASAMLEGVES